MRPQIVFPESGFHNHKNLDHFVKGNSYKDLSTVCVVPTRGVIAARVVQSWMGLIPPMNQKFMRMFISHMEVADAYNSAVETILAHPELSKWKFLLTLEEDNLPAPDSLLKLYESIEKFDAVGGLYWTKGAGGQPMIYGNPKEMPKSFIPQLPQPDSIQPCNGLGMGFTLFRLSMFKKLPKPWFKTLAEYKQDKGVSVMTQDLYFFQEAAKEGYKFACDTRARVGHYSIEEDIVW